MMTKIRNSKFLPRRQAGKIQNLRVALVHDYLKEYGGAERVLKVLSEMFPEAPIYTAFLVKDSSAAKEFAGKRIVTSWANSFLGWKNLYSPLRFLTPLIWESFDFRGYDVVISSASWYVTKSIITRPETLHICYCHTPPRWLYGFPTAVEWKRFLPIRIYGEIIAHFLRLYDFAGAQRVDEFVANSENVQKRIDKFYRRRSTVIYPPVETKAITKAALAHKPQNYYLAVARVVGAKGLDLAIRAANELKVPLKIIGEPAGLRWEERKLQVLKGDTVQFLGRLPDKEMWRYLGRCKAFLALATDEDFGMTPVEAMAAGRPVIAFAGGGYLETVVDGKTGVFFKEPTTQSLIAAMKRLDTLKINPEDCRKQAEKFSKEVFVKKMSEFIQKVYAGVT